MEKAFLAGGEVFELKTKPQQHTNKTLEDQTPQTHSNTSTIMVWLFHLTSISVF